ncbi:DNA topoisomerase III, partial [Streptococcus danieliae]|nr:DNA topoisomerase III [Streptococcus danieliae]
RAISGGEYSSVAKQILQAKDIKSTKIVNNAKVTDHHAIIPTEERANYMLMSDMETKIYNLVTKRFLENLLDNYEYKEITMYFEIDG